MNKPTQNIKYVDYKKNISVPIREWNNNHYSFNKRNEILSLSYLNTSNEMIKPYLDLSHKEKTRKSRRMINYKKRISFSRVFKSDIQAKQTGDSINLGVYLFNKQDSLKSKQLYLISKQLDNYKKINSYTSKKFNILQNENLMKTIAIGKYLNISNKTLNKKKKIKSLNYKNKFNKLSNINLTKRRFRPFKLANENNKYYREMYNKNMNFYYQNHSDSVRELNKKIRSKFKYNAKSLKSISSTSNKRKIFLKKKLSKKFLKERAFLRLKKLMVQSKKNLFYDKIANEFTWSFIYKKIKIYRIALKRYFYLTILRKNGLNLKISKNNLFIEKNSGNKQSIFKMPLPFNLEILRKRYKKLNKKKRNVINFRKLKKYYKGLYSRKKCKNIYASYMISSNVIINKLLHRIIVKLMYNKKKKDNTITVSSNKKMNLMYNLYKEFIENNANKVFESVFFKQFLMIEHIHSLYINASKSTLLVKNLKYIFNKIYNKKTSVNITNLKYSHLNGDIFTRVLEMKLQKRKSRLARNMKKGFKLFKLGYSPIKNKNPNKSINLYKLINDMFKIHTYLKKSKVNLLASKYNNKLYLAKNTNSIEINSKTKEILTKIKHKWTAGVKLEVKGRLSTRYLASRSLHKYRIKGNLKNESLDNFKRDWKGVKIKKKTSSSILFRGIHSPNIQYTRKAGLRKIGSFGLKIWINNR